MFSEVSKNFAVPPKKVMQAMTENEEYIPPLSPKEYVERISKHLRLSDRITEIALGLLTQSTEGSSPTIRACCAVIKAANRNGLKIKICDIASTLDVTTTGIRFALKRAEIQ
jgi:transcription initiation factor TFIIIB Brf1 subunit/transcription initiation factor TFIIB